MPPKSQLQFEEIREKSKQQIMKAALKLFAESGYYATSISNIAKEAGVAKGLLYNYFGSKMELLEYLITIGMGELEKIFQSVATEEAPFKKLEKMIQLSFEAVKKDKKFWKLYTMLMTQMSEMDNIKNIMHPIVESGFEFMTQIFKELKISQPEIEARKVGACMDGIILHYLFIDENYPINEVLENILKPYKDTFN